MPCLRRNTPTAPMAFLTCVERLAIQGKSDMESQINLSSVLINLYYLQIISATPKNAVSFFNFLRISGFFTKFAKISIS